MLRCFSSRRASLYETFLKERLAAPKRYDRIAGYFQSSLFDLANQELAAIPEVRIVCNTEVNADDVKTVRMAAVAKLIGTLDPLPILIVAPKPLLAQWEEELLQKLQVPSARWEGDGWLTERRGNPKRSSIIAA